MIEICRYMGGWDYYTFINQPIKFIEVIRIKKNLEGEYQQWQIRKSKQ